MREASARGVFAVRRGLAPESFPVFQGIVESLQPELVNVCRIFEVRSLGTTVIGFSRFDCRHRGKGPSSNSISERIASSSRPLEAKLGQLGIFGSEAKAKLGFSLVSDELIREQQMYESRFAKVRFPLKPDPNAENQYTPHISIALLYNDYLGQFSDEVTLDRLSSIANVLGQTIVLKSVFESKD